MTDTKTKRIVSIVLNATTITNILDLEVEFAAIDGGDIIEPQFVPNTITAVDVEEWDGKTWKVKIVLNGDHTTFATYAKRTAVNPVIPTFVINLEAEGGTAIVWTWSGSKAYISKKDAQNVQGRYEIEEYRETIYEMVIIGARTVS